MATLTSPKRAARQAQPLTQQYLNHRHYKRAISLSPGQLPSATVYQEKKKPSLGSLLK